VRRLWLAHSQETPSGSTLRRSVQARALNAAAVLRDTPLEGSWGAGPLRLTARTAASALATLNIRVRGVVTLSFQSGYTAANPNFTK
jgi:hypothetical protein